MGNATPQGKARFLQCVLPYTLWLEKEIDAAKQRYRETGSDFALDLEKFAYILATTQSGAKEIFDIFDTGSIGLVDSFESLGTVALLTATEIEHKVSFVFDMYDFNGNNKITVDEMAIMLRTAAAGLSKLDNNLKEPTTTAVEQVVAASFSRAQKDPDEELTREEFDACCLNSVHIREFLEYVDGAAGHARIEPGGSWTDPEWGAGAGAFLRDSYCPHRAHVAWPNVLWRRPADLLPDELQLVIQGVPPCSIEDAGHLAGSWMPNVLELMATRPALIQALFVKTGQESKGRFCLQFYLDGNLRLVYVDDHLPCTLHEGRPLFMRGESPNEAWMMLIQKAYAKLHGSYETSAPGKITAGLEDFTGGLASRLFPFEYDDRELLHVLEVGVVQGLVGAAFLPDEGATLRTHHASTTIAERGGSVCGVCYAVLGVCYVDQQEAQGGEAVRASPESKESKESKEGGVPPSDTSSARVELRVPSSEHRRLSAWAAQIYKATKGSVANAELGGASVGKPWTPKPSSAAAETVNEDVMRLTLDQFRAAFNTLYVCRIFDKPWELQKRSGVWTGKTSGGSLASNTWIKNEQYALEVKEQCELVVTIQQSDPRGKIRETAGDGVAPLPSVDVFASAIGFAVVEHDFGDGPFRTQLKNLREASVRKISLFAKRRSVSETFSLSPGRYVVIPSTFEPGGLGYYQLLVRCTSPSTELRSSPEIMWDADSEGGGDHQRGRAGEEDDDEEEDEDGADDDDVSELVQQTDDPVDASNVFRDDQTASELRYMHALVAELCDAVDLQVFIFAFSIARLRAIRLLPRPSLSTTRHTLTPEGALH